jgi:hypothetical protein
MPTVYVSTQPNKELETQKAIDRSQIDGFLEQFFYVGRTEWAVQVERLKAKYCEDVYLITVWKDDFAIVTISQLKSHIKALNQWKREIKK